MCYANFNMGDIIFVDILHRTIARQIYSELCILTFQILFFFLQRQYINHYNSSACCLVFILVHRHVLDDLVSLWILY